MLRGMNTLAGGVGGLGRDAGRELSKMVLISISNEGYSLRKDLLPHQQVLFRRTPIFRRDMGK